MIFLRVKKSYALQLRIYRLQFTFCTTNSEGVYKIKQKFLVKHFQIIKQNFRMSFVKKK